MDMRLKTIATKDTSGTDLNIFRRKKIELLGKLLQKTYNPGENVKI